MFATIRTGHFFGMTATLVVCVLVFSNAGFADESGSATLDDGWRRTADGWEHISTWYRPIARVNKPAEIVRFTPALIAFHLPQSPLLHPAAIAGGLLLIGLSCLAWSPPVLLREAAGADS